MAGTLSFELLSLRVKLANQALCSDSQLAEIPIGVRGHAVRDHVGDVDRVVDGHVVHIHDGTSCVAANPASAHECWLPVARSIISEPFLDPTRHLEFAPRDDVRRDPMVLRELAAALQPPDCRTREACSFADNRESQQLDR
jgi:hypothetical protein